MKTKLDQYLLRGFANKTLTWVQIKKILWELHLATPKPIILSMHLVKKYVDANIIEPLEELTKGLRSMFDDLE